MISLPYNGHKITYNIGQTINGIIPFLVTGISYTDILFIVIKSIVCVVSEHGVRLNVNKSAQTTFS
jgi:hypothetical protein